MRRLFPHIAFLALVAAPLAAQSGDPTDDLITRVIADVSDLRYADAIARGREVLVFVRGMTPAQEALLRSAIAAAFYPEETGAQQPDSAIAQFVAGLAVKPDLALPVELRWAGLDSLLDVARGRSFAVVVSAEPQVLVGPEGRGALQVLSSRPATFALRTALVGASAGFAQSATTTAATQAALEFRALAPGELRLAPGEYTATIVARDPQRGDSVTLQRRLLVEGQPLLRIAPPAFDESQLRRETKRAPLLRSAFTTVALAALTVGIGSVIAAGGEIEDGLQPSGGAIAAGVVVLGAGAGWYWLRRNQPDRDAIAHNAALREAHRQAVDAAATESRAREDAYRVTVRLAEPRSP